MKKNKICFIFLQRNSKINRIFRMRDAPQILEQEYLDIRHQLLEIAAFFDRLDSTESGTPQDDIKIVRARKALALLADPSVSTKRCKMISELYSGTNTDFQ